MRYHYKRYATAHSKELPKGSVACSASSLLTGRPAADSAFGAVVSTFRGVRRGRSGAERGPGCGVR